MMPVSAVKTGWTYPGANMTVASGATTTFNFTMTADPGNYKGTVSSSAGGTVAGAIVTINGISGTTDSNGNYTITGIAAGSGKSLTAIKANFTNYTSTVTVTSDSTTTYNFTMTAYPGTVTGTITSSAGGTVAGAVVSIAGVQGTSDSNGNYTIPNVPAGSNETLTASSSTYTYGGANLTVTSNAVTTFNFMMNANPGNITGIVTSSIGGSVLSGVNVTIGGISGTTNSSGVYTITGIAAGNESVSATLANYTYSGANVIVPVAGNANFSFVMQAIPGAVSGSISPTGVNVTVTLNPGNYSTTSSTGSYSIGNLLPGSYNVTATATGYQNYTSGQITVNLNQFTTQNISMNPNTVTGMITSSLTGNPALQGANVTIGGISGTTNSSGIYTLSAVPAGNVAYSITLTNYTTSSGNVLISQGANTGDNYQLQAILGNITGTITGYGSDSVTVTTNTGGYSTTTSNGTYLITGVAPGNYTVSATSSHYYYGPSSQITVNLNQNTTQNFQ